MISVGFIFPSSEYLFNPFKGDPHTHFQILTVLDSYFKDDVNLSLIDLRGIKREFAIYHIPECDVYLHSVYTLDYEEQVNLVRYIRERFPKAKHIAGGPHVLVFQQECLKIFDSIVLGDAEVSIIEVINDVLCSQLKRIYRQNKPVDINLYPYPKRKFLPKSSIARKGMMNLSKKKGYEEVLGTTAVFSRGCPFSCAFCAMPGLKEFNSGVRYRAPELVREEIQYLMHEYGIAGINVLDEIGIPPNLEQAIMHLEAIQKTGVLWRGQCRVDGINAEIARTARASGCVALGLGIESVSQISLDIMNKKINISKVKETIKHLKENDIEVRIYVIIGLPGEPKDIVDQTWNFIKETSPDLVILSLFTVRPGTIVFEKPKEFGIKHIMADWKNSMHMFSRYDNEIPTLTFEYERETKWGVSFSNEQIIVNYLELQKRLKEFGLSSLI